eukprot:sb/3462875/
MSQNANAVHGFFHIVRVLRGGRGGGRPGRRLEGRIAGIQRFREETGEEEDEPPVKKALSSVARLGPLPVPKKNSEDEEDEEEEGETTENDAPSLMSAVTCPVLNRDSASSVVSDSKNLNRSKRLFGSLLMGTLRQFKQDKEKTKDTDIKQQEMWGKVEKKEAQEAAKTAEDRQKLVRCKGEVHNEIRLLEQQMELAQMPEDVFLCVKQFFGRPSFFPVSFTIKFSESIWKFPLFRQKTRATTERDRLAGFIRTKSKPYIYYLPKEHTEETENALEDSNHRVNKEYQVRIQGYEEKLSNIKNELLEHEDNVAENVENISTVKLEKIMVTKVVRRASEEDNEGESEKPAFNPETGIKVEVQLREEADRSEDSSDDGRSSPAPRSNGTKRAPSRSPKRAPSRSPSRGEEKESSEKKSREKRRDSERRRSGGEEKDRPDQGTRVRTESGKDDTKSTSDKDVKRSKNRSASPVEDKKRSSPSPRERKKSPARKQSPPSRSRRSRSPRKRSPRKRSPQKRSRSPKRRSRSPRKQRSRSPQKRSRSPQKRSRSPQKRSRSPRKRSSPRPKSKSSPPRRNKSRSPGGRNKSRSPEARRNKSPGKQRSSPPRKESSPPRKEGSTSKKSLPPARKDGSSSSSSSGESSSSGSSSGED